MNKLEVHVSSNMTKE